MKTERVGSESVISLNIWSVNLNRLTLNGDHVSLRVHFYWLGKSFYLSWSAYPGKNWIDLKCYSNHWPQNSLKPAKFPEFMKFFEADPRGAAATHRSPFKWQQWCHFWHTEFIGNQWCHWWQWWSIGDNGNPFRSFNGDNSGLRLYCHYIGAKSSMDRPCRHLIKHRSNYPLLATLTFTSPAAKMAKRLVNT